MRTRAFTAIALLAVTLGALFSTSVWPVAAIAMTGAWICAQEVKTFARGAASIPPLHALLVALGVPFFVQDPGGRVQWLLMAIVACLLGVILMAPVVRMKDPPAMSGVGAALWPTGGLICLVVLHQSRPTTAAWDFHNPALLALVPLWFGDTFAYLVGRAIGKTPLAPTISPNKTVEGAIANVIFSIAAAVGVGWWVHVPVWMGLAAGAIAGFVGQAGDLFESWAKRSVGLKDSGSLLPGHGGLMDRLDSVLLTAPFVAALVVLCSR